MSSSEVRPIGSEGVNNHPKSVALPTKADGIENKSTPDSEVSSDYGDAVTVNVSGKKVDYQTAASAEDEEKTAREVTLESAQKVAENLKRAFHEINSTTVSFDVAIQESGASSLSFQVIDTESGKVVREFPPEIAKSLNHKIGQSDKRGVLVEESA